MYVRSETKYNRKRDHHDKGKFKLCSHRREETDRRERERKGKSVRRIVRAKEAANVRVREEERDRPERRGQSERASERQTGI